MKGSDASLAALAAALLPMVALADDPSLSFTKLWTYSHAPIAGQVSEIPAYDPKTRTLWIAGIVGVDILDAATGAPVDHIDTTAHGVINSVAINDGVAAFAIESATRTDPGKVLFYSTRSRTPLVGNNPVTVGALPDMLAFSPDGRQLLVANEGTPSTYGARIGTSVPRVYADAVGDPAGSVSIIDVRRRIVTATPGFAGVPTSGSNLRRGTGMDFEPEYLAFDAEGRQAYVTLQEANAIGVLDLRRNAFTSVIGLGAKDFSLPGNQIDPLNNGATPPTIEFISPAAKGFYMPDSIATYEWRGQTLLAMANEGDFREDDADRSAASGLGAIAPLNNLRVSNSDSSPGNLFAAGARSFSIRDTQGTLVYDSGDILDKEAARRGLYDDGRSRDKGVEPEGVALRRIDGRIYAFIGLERTLSGAVAVFDVSNPYAVAFIDMIVTDGDVAPEGLVVFRERGDYFLAIANEVSNTTTVYRLTERGRHDDRDDDRDDLGDDDGDDDRDDGDRNR